MKIKNVFDLIFSMENLYGALEDASDQRRYNKDVMLFNFNAWDNLKEIRDSVYDGTYTIDKYYIFYVYEPKKRMIMSIKFKHRVVQWAIYRVINPMLIKGYIKDSYGCIPERGPLTAMFRLKYWLEQVNRKDEQWYYLKLDISKYFYRISHRIEQYGFQFTSDEEKNVVEGTEDMETELKKLGYRMKFPAKTGDLSRRWCSAYLKIMVADTVMSNLGRLQELEQLGGKRHKFPAKGTTHQGRWCSGNLKAAVQDSVTSNLEQTKKNVKILIVSGERRGESKGRSKYNEIEVHRTNAPAKAHRIVHQWRPVIDYSEKDVWEVLKRHNTNPHPCYRAGWNRCSCAMCIFSTPKLFAGIKEIYPEEFEALKKDEEILGFTLDNKCDLETFVGNAESCVYHGDFEALRSLVTGEFTTDDVYVKGQWMYPAGAFHGAEGGPC